MAKIRHRLPHCLLTLAYLPHCLLTLAYRMAYGPWPTTLPTDPIRGSLGAAFAGSQDGRAWVELLKSQVSAAPALCLSHTVLTLCLRTRLVTAPHPLALRCAACYHMQAITCTTPDHSIAARSCIYVLHCCISTHVVSGRIRSRVWRGCASGSRSGHGAGCAPRRSE